MDIAGILNINHQGEYQDTLKWAIRVIAAIVNNNPGKINYILSAFQEINIIFFGGFYSF